MEIESKTNYTKAHLTLMQDDRIMNFTDMT
jgi:hypothetical protein